MPLPKKPSKDLKRLVRSRMQKTGESYTTARHHVISKRPTAKAPAKNGTPPPAPSTADLEQRAGMRDAVIAAKTGRSWAQWAATLDAAGATAMNHTQIAALVHEQFGVPGWWAQGVTVGYERIRGRRSKNQVAGGKFAVSKSRTFAVPLATLLKALAPRAREQWLGAKASKERKSTAKTVRWIEADGTWVDVFPIDRTTSKGAAKCTANVQHSRLASRADVDTWRARWAERLQALADWLARRA